MDRLVKFVYLTLTENGFSTFSGLISFVVWELKNCMGISVWYWSFGILVMDNCMGILVQYWYFGILVLDKYVSILGIVLVN